MNGFEKIYSDNYTTMIRVATKMIGGGEDVRDIVQDVFMNLLDRLNDGQEIRHPESWLYRATFNKCVDIYRKRSRYQKIKSALPPEAGTETLEKYETREVLNRALCKLKPRERALAVFYSEGMSYREMSEATGVRLSSIGKMLSRTLKKLEMEFKKQGYELY